MPKEKNDPERPIRVSLVANEIAEQCEKQQKYHTKMAQDFGYSKEVFQDMANQMKNVSDYHALGSVEASLNRFKNFLDIKSEQFEKYTFDVSSNAYALSTSALVSTAIYPAEIDDNWGIVHDYPEPPPDWKANRTEIYTEKLSKFDPEIGRLYSSIWPTFYSGIENSERGVLFNLGERCRVLNSELKQFLV